MLQHFDIVTRSKLVAVILTMLFGLTLTACGASGSSDPVSTRPPDGTAQHAPRYATAGVCVDGTGSSAPSYAATFVKTVAAAVGAWAPAPASEQQGSAPAHGGLRFVIRSVTTDSISTDGAATPQTIAAVPALAPRPTPGSKNFDDDLRTWLSTEAEWRSKAGAAAAQAAAARQSTLRFTVVRKTSSGVWSCLSALAAQLNVNGPRGRLVEMTDAENNAAVVDLRLHDAAVLLVMVCPALRSSACPARFAAARSMLLKHGASSVDLVRSDAVTPTTVLNFWRAGS